MVFVQRDSGNIVGVYANLQPGLAEEELPDDDAAVTAFRESIARIRQKDAPSPDATL